MSNEKKVPCKCNHCNSTNIIHQIWGRVEFWSCKDCKNEVTYVEPDFGKPWGWDTKTYGFGSSIQYDSTADLTKVFGLPAGYSFDFNKSINDILNSSNGGSQDDDI